MIMLRSIVLFQEKIQTSTAWNQQLSDGLYGKNLAKSFGSVLASSTDLREIQFPHWLFCGSEELKSLELVV